jgi:altronate dehydratase small subunit
MKKYILLHEKDNVITMLVNGKSGSAVRVKWSGTVNIIRLKDNVPFGHKCAIKNIVTGETVIKYGEIIGIAVKDIEIGNHVHSHNVKSIRGTIENISFKRE